MRVFRELLCQKYVNTLFSFNDHSVTKFTEQDPSWEDNDCWVTTVNIILWNPKFFILLIKSRHWPLFEARWIQPKSTNSNIWDPFQYYHHNGGMLTNIISTHVQDKWRRVKGNGKYVETFQTYITLHSILRARRGMRQSKEKETQKHRTVEKSCMSSV
jgi:hypothetical protein